MLPLTWLDDFQASMEKYQGASEGFEPSADELIDVLKNLENLAAANPALYRAIVDQIKGISGTLNKLKRSKKLLSWVDETTKKNLTLWTEIVDFEQNLIFPFLVLSVLFCFKLVSAFAWLGQESSRSS